MFCGKCGLKNADDAAFCTGCGAKLSGKQVVKNSTPVVVSSNDKNRKVGMIFAAVIAAIIITLIVALFGGRSYKATVEKCIDAELNADGEAYFELVPEEVITYLREKEGYGDDEQDEYQDKVIENYRESAQSYLDDVERYLGEDWTASHEILTVKDITGNELDDLKNAYENIDIKVSAAKTAEVNLTVKAGETESSNSVVIPVIKIGRSWYLDLESLQGIF